MTREEAINHLKTVAKSAIDSGYDGAVVDAVDMAIKVIEQEACGKDINVPATDAISRQAVLDALESIGSLDTEADKKYARSVFEALPSVQPKQKTGHWIKTKEQDDAEPLILWKCSECLTVQRLKTNYCPNCGAKMIEPQESKVKE